MRRSLCIQQGKDIYQGEAEQEAPAEDKQQLAMVLERLETSWTPCMGMFPSDSDMQPSTKWESS